MKQFKGINFFDQGLKNCKRPRPRNDRTQTLNSSDRKAHTRVSTLSTHVSSCDVCGVWRALIARMTNRASSNRVIPTPTTNRMTAPRETASRRCRQAWGGAGRRSRGMEMYECGICEMWAAVAVAGNERGRGSSASVASRRVAWRRVASRGVASAASVFQVAFSHFNRRAFPPFSWLLETYRETSPSPSTNAPLPTAVALVFYPSLLSLSLFLLFLVSFSVSFIVSRLLSSFYYQYICLWRFSRTLFKITFYNAVVIARPAYSQPFVNSSGANTWLNKEYRLNSIARNLGSSRQTSVTSSRMHATRCVASSVYMCIYMFVCVRCGVYHRAGMRRGGFTIFFSSFYRSNHSVSD